MSRILRVFMVMVVSLASVLAHAVGSSDNTDFSQGASAMQISLQKEVYGILLSDTAEVQQEYRADGTFYTSDALAPYRSILKTICAEAARSDCPDITFTKRTLQGIAAMYPNGVLALNEELMARLTLDEATFILAHEFGHFHLAHSKRRIKVLAKAIVDNSIPLLEPEQALAAAGFLSEVREIHHVYEREADAYGYAYIAKKGIAIDCLRLYHKIAGDEPVSTDKHDPIEERCRGR